MEEPAAESVVGSGIDTDTKIDTAAPLEVTVRVTFVGQKANQGQLLPLLLPAAACRQAEAPVDPENGTEQLGVSIEGSGVAKTAILQLLADSAAIDLQRWSPLWYDVRSKGWRDVEEIGHWRPRGDGALDVRMVDRSAPSGCTPEGQLPVVGVGAAASDLGEEVRRGADAGGRSTAGVQGTVTAEHEDSGYFGIGVVGLKTEANLGTLWRSAWQLGAAFIFTVGARFEKQGSDTYQTWTRVPCFEHSDWAGFARASPYSAPWVAVEMGGVPLEDFEHPDRAVYVLGSEDTGLPESVVRACALHVSLPSVRSPSFNVAVAGSILMYDRYAKRKKR